MNEHKCSWASKCPVTRREHAWEKIISLGSPVQAYCPDCEAQWIGVEKEWEIYERGLDEYVESRLTTWYRRQK